MRSTLSWLSHRRTLGRIATRVPFTRPMVARFVAGESLEAALPALDRMRAAGFRSVNIDLIYGLPYQTAASFEKTLTDNVLGFTSDIELTSYGNHPLPDFPGTSAYLRKQLPEIRELTPYVEREAIVRSPRGVARASA